MSTNRVILLFFNYSTIYYFKIYQADTLDPALLRPGRLDRKIECPFPDRR